MHHLSNVELTLYGLMLEATFGYPDFIYRAIGHPVTWMGGLLGWLELRLNHPCAAEHKRRLLGVFSVIILIAVTVGAAFVLTTAAPQNAVAQAALILAATSLLAQRSLYDHVYAVAKALDRDGLEEGRRAVAMIVGRNTALLDEAGVARAAIESLAENFSDGIVGPTFWLVVAGLQGAATFKAANTADSMIGHRTTRYRAFGWAAARLDDIINLPASRLSTIFLVLGALAAGASPNRAISAVRHDARRHRSPNAGWPEAAMAGALGLQLGGPRIYGQTLVEDAFMGSGGRPQATAADIIAALRVYKAACVIQVLTLMAVAFIEKA
jgi:adenosylcobinamide-phosphate synthase